MVLSLKPQGRELGSRIFDIGYDGFHQFDAKLPAAPRLEDGDAFDLCNARPIDAPARRGDRPAIINPHYVTAGILMFVNFEVTGNELFDLKHQGANDNAAAVINLGFGQPENNHGPLHM